MTDQLPTHSKLGASSTHRWMVCPGSVRLCEDLEDAPNEASVRGTMAHFVAAECLENDYDASQYVGKSYEIEGFKFTFNEEDRAAVQVYLDTIRADALHIDKGSAPYRFVERKFHLKELHADLFGTADCVQVWPREKLMRVYDYKHGKSPVEVEHNSQLKYYALGALIKYGKPIKEIELVIVQPRCKHSFGPVRRHRFPAFELLDFEGELVKAAKATEDPNAPLVAGEHCWWCRARKTCPKQQEKRQEQARKDFAEPAATNFSDVLACPICRAKYVRDCKCHQYQDEPIAIGRRD